MFKRAAVILAVLLVLPVALYALNVAAGYFGAARTSGTVRIAGLRQSVDIVRDDRDIVHIRASNDDDAYFAQGYAEASDRLFQMDLVRRFVTGRLAEVLGAAALPADEHARVVPIDSIVNAEWTHLAPAYRKQLQAFADGVNAAMRDQPLPVEFRVLTYKPEPWRPTDTLACGFSIVLDLIDDWDDVVRRDAAVRAYGARIASDLYSISDPAYDAPVTGRPARVAPLGAGPHAARFAFATEREARANDASNDWALGGAYTRSGGALVANDPHLRLGIPGVWYLVELQTPRLHVAGATFAGIPGVILGHNERIAWGVTNGTVVSDVVYRDTLRGARIRRERFHVRFGKDVERAYYETRHGFAIDDRRGYAVDWNFVRFARTPLPTFDGLDRARSVKDALAVLRDYPGPTQNFVVGGSDGTVAYHLAGMIPDDPSWGMRVHEARDPLYGFVPFTSLPHVDASRSARVFTANNRMYGAGYPYRLSAAFAPPYRAWRIERLLPRGGASAQQLFRMQSDTFSPAESELARDVVAASTRKRVTKDHALQSYLRAIASWNGRFDGGSRAATLMYEYRRALTTRMAVENAPRVADDYLASADHADMVLTLRVLRERARGWCPRNDCDALLIDTLRRIIAQRGTALLQTWSEHGEVPVRHPLSALGLAFLNGGTLPGDGDAFSVHVLTAAPHSQSFRAVWDTRDWNAGGIIIPSGESGEPGSGHYTDLRDAWNRATLVPLPFGSAAVAAHSRSRLVLLPAAPQR